MIYKYRLNQLEDRIPYELLSVIPDQSWTFLVNSVRNHQLKAKSTGNLYYAVGIVCLLTIPLSCWSNIYINATLFLNLTSFFSSFHPF